MERGLNTKWGWGRDCDRRRTVAPHRHTDQGGPGAIGTGLWQCTGTPIHRPRGDSGNTLIQHRYIEQRARDQSRTAAIKAPAILGIFVLCSYVPMRLAPNRCIGVCRRIWVGEGNRHIGVFGWGGHSANRRIGVFEARSASTYRHILGGRALSVCRRICAVGGGMASRPMSISAGVQDCTVARGRCIDVMRNAHVDCYSVSRGVGSVCER